MIKGFCHRLVACGWRSILIRTLILSGGWWVMSEADRSAIAFGLPVVLLALSASVLLPSPEGPGWSPVGLVRYAIAFLTGSLHGGIDVARRALAPRLRLSPAMVRYPLRLPEGPARHLFMGTLNLMPGTLSVNMDADELEIHVLIDRGEDVARQLKAIEARVAHALGEPLERSRA